MSSAIVLLVAAMACDTRPTSRRAGDVNDLQAQLDAVAEQIEQARVERQAADEAQDAVVAELSVLRGEELGRVAADLDLLTGAVDEAGASTEEHVDWLESTGYPMAESASSLRGRYDGVTTRSTGIETATELAGRYAVELDASLGASAPPSLLLAGMLRMMFAVDTLNHALRFTGDLRVVDGSGATLPGIPGLGNVIVGYDEGDVDAKTASHSLVVGPFHDYAGSSNVIFGRSSGVDGNGGAVLGGSDNTVSAGLAVVVGGVGSIADEAFSVLP